MPANAKRREPDLEQDAVPAGGVTPRDVAMLSGEELVLRFGASVAQGLVDLVVAAIRKGDDDEVAAIDGRLQEVERVLRGEKRD